MKNTLFLLIVLVVSWAIAACRPPGGGVATDEQKFFSPGAAADPDGYLEVDCLLPGQVRKLGTMVYVSPRRPIKTTAANCEIRGGEYVLYDRSNYREALAVWMVDAQEGDPVAQTYVGEIYLNSPPDAPRYDLAAEWFQKAAAQDHKRALINLAYLYENGLGVTADQDTALELYHRTTADTGQAIVQQQQLGIEERAELARLRADNATQANQLQDLQQQYQQLQSSFGKRREDLAERNERIARQQQELEGQQEQLRQLRREITQAGNTEKESVDGRLAALRQEIEKKESELREQQRLAAQLSREMDESQQQTATYEKTIAALEQKLAALPGPKIEVYDPQLLRTRGIIIAPVTAAVRERTIEGKVWAPAGLRSLQVNGNAVPVADTGSFNATVALAEKRLAVEITATDANGATEKLEFELQQDQTLDSPERASDVALERVDFGRYFALVIGNNQYRELPRLTTAVADAQVMAKVLEENYGFEVTLLTDADRTTILTSLNEFRQKLTEKDNFLLYYAGHGTLVERNTEGFWLPVDSAPDNDVNWIPTDRITGIMNLMSAKQIMVIADACYSGIMTRAGITRLESGRSGEAYQKWLKKMINYKSRVVLSSGENKPVLDVGGGEHSVFANALLEILQNNHKILLGMDLHRAIAKKVVDVSNRIGLDQVPQYAGLNRAGHELGDFLFVPN